MLQWKQRLYAFLLRRALGPLLDKGSLTKLHQSIDVSLQEGRFTLRDVALNVDDLTTRLDSLAVRAARLDWLEIQFTLEEHDETATSSLAWRAMQLGAASEGQASSVVSLLARVKIDGLLIDVVPDATARPPTSQTVVDEQVKAVKSRLTSYLDAALASLRLSVDLTNVRVRVGSMTRDDWLEVRLDKATYRDVTVDTTVMVSKMLEVERLAVAVGETTHQEEARRDQVSPPIVLLEGNSQVHLRAVEASQDRVQNDVSIRLGQRLNMSLDDGCVRLVRALAMEFRLTKESSIPETLVEPEQIIEEVAAEEVEEVEADLRTIEGIMKQYQAARLLAEQNQFRGGILLPDEDNDDTDGITFDAFFDANDHSLARYSTILKESILFYGVDGSTDSFVHTKLHVHLPEGGLKLVLSPMTVKATRRADEYVLLTFSDLSLSSSISATHVELSLNIAQLDVEDSQLECSNAARAEIGSVLRFSPEESGAYGDSDVLIQAPCVSVSAKMDKANDSKSIQIDVALEPVEFTYRHRTLSNLSAFLAAVGDVDAGESAEASADSSSEAKRRGDKLALFLNCASVGFVLPVLIEQDWTPLYGRCGVDHGNSWSTRACVSVLFDQLCVESTGEKADPLIHFACNRIIVYAAGPSDHHRMHRRLDFLSLSGHADVEPSIPVSLDVWRNAADTDSRDNVGATTFPTIPAISSFKARQEDEDDDNRIDRVLASKIEGITVGTTRGELRGNDPQPGMVLEASRSEIVLQLKIPDIVTDVAVDELVCLATMLSGIVPARAEPAVDPAIPTPTPTPTDGPTIGLAVDCDYVALGLHGCDADSSFLVHLEAVKIHALRQGATLRQLRFLTSESVGYEVSRLGDSLSLDEPFFAKSRVDQLRARVVRRFDTKATPLFHRSHLFPAISHSSPTLVLDVIVPAKEDADDIDHGPAQKNVHLTLYDFTFRYDVGSSWVERLMALLAQVSANKESSSPLEISESALPLITRVFLSVADCNLDYSSSAKFKTPSRAIVRLGDLRVSSNIVWPKPLVQAYSIALGDAAVYLCKSRFPYNFENSRLPRADSILSPDDLSLRSLGLAADATPENVQKAMGLLTTVMLESFDAVVAVTNRKRRSVDPTIQANLTVGELGVFACKDSFSRLLATVGELSTEMTALNSVALEELRAKAYSFDDDEAMPEEESSTTKTRVHALEDLKRQSALRPTAGTAYGSVRPDDYLLDGYDWTAIDQDESVASMGIPPGEEQVARWYGASLADSLQAQEEADEVAFLPSFSTPELNSSPSKRAAGPRIITHHFPLLPVTDPLGDGDMGLSKYVKTQAQASIGMRLLVHDASIRLRLFDGYDWPELLDAEQRERSRATKAFVIEEAIEQANKDKLEESMGEELDSGDQQKLERKAALLGDLLSGTDNGDASPGTFRDLPLPEERGAQLKEQAELRRLARRTGKYFQFSASGLSLRLDSLEESREHRLASLLNLKVQDFFLAETISGDRPVKLAGEWVNESEHPRDTKHGLFMLRMVTWHPRTRVTPNNEIVEDEAQAVAQILPLRCLIDQTAVRFIRAFVQSHGESETALPAGRYAVPPPLFRSFCFKPFKLKVDYRPTQIDTKALRDGAYVELINLSPIDGMILTLQQVKAENVLGWGGVMGHAVRQWIQDICSTQIHKFLTNTRPLEPITHVGGSAADLIVLPWEAIANGESVQKALRAGVHSFSSAVVYETFTMTSKATQFLADQVAKVSTSFGDDSVSSQSVLLPSRPLDTPRGLIDTTPHAIESLSRGLQAANYKVVIVPYREYRRRGAKGAAESVLRGIPVAIAAPASGVAEALSFALLGARNQIRPDIRKEEEASQRGLHLDA